MKTKIKIKFLQEMIIATFFIIFFLSYIKVIPFDVCNFYYIFILFFFILRSIQNIRDDAMILLACIVTVVLGIICGIHTDKLEVSVYFKTVAYILIGYFYSKDGMGTFCHKLIFWIYEVILVYLILISAENLNNIFSTLSRNYISVFSMIATIIFYIGEEKNNNQIKLYPSIINFVICVGGIGRGGIISSAILLLCVIYLKYFFTADKYKKILFVLIAIFIVIAIIIAPSILKRYSVYFQRFIDNGFESDGRSAILNEYFNRIISNPVDAILGVNLKYCPTALYYNINFHNTILQMHFTYGIIFSFAVIYLSIKSCKNFIKNKKQILAILFLSYVVRSVLDQVGYAFYGEIFIYYFIFEGSNCLKTSGIFKKQNLKNNGEI